MPGDEKKDRTVTLFGAREAVRSFGDNVSMPYVPFYLTRLNATLSQMGVFQALQSLLPNIFQLPWGYISDRLGRRVPFIVAGAVLASMTLIFATFVSDVTLLIMIFSLNAVALSIMIPTTSALLGDKIKHGERGRGLSKILNFALVAGILGNISVLVYFTLFSSTDVDVFRTLLVVGAVFGLVSVVFIIPIKDKGSSKVKHRFVTWSKLCPEFRYFVKAQVIYNFFMSFAWPVFYITMAYVLGASNMEIAISTLIGVVATIAFQPLVGRVLDKAGPVGLIIVSRFVFVIVPFAYGFANAMWQIYVLNLVLGVGMAIINVAFTAYILDMSTEETKAEHFSYHNLAVGVAGFAGSLIGGFMANYLQSIWPLATALLIVYVASGFGRLAAANMYFDMRDSQRYPTTTRQIANEYITRLRIFLYRQ